ncbi:PhzF family phenazine biosynthesis protein, partial [Aeromicrobium sp. Root472D3]|uniref:PhzF family phenazine biosynthesis protein n=1 Tax=Aeromicrobium sp. Root472D3 TaxID=1736540 RepID=UPI001F1FDA6C
GGEPQRPGQLVQECGAGLVRVREDGSRLAFAAPPLRRGGPVDEADVRQVADALGIERADVIGAQWADNGPGWIALLLRSADAVLAIEPRGFGELDKVGVVGPHAAGGPADVEVRAFYPGSPGEDPVTGSLNAAIGQWLIGSGLATDSYVAAQGTRLGRRGRVHVERVDDDVWVGGDTVVGVSGTVAL